MARTWVIRVAALMSGGLMFLLALQIRHDSERTGRESVPSPGGATVGGNSTPTLPEALGWLATAKPTTFRAGPGEINEAALRPDGSLVTVSTRDRIKLWDPAAGESLAEIRAHRRGIRCLAIHPDGSRVATGGPDRTVQIHELDTRETTGTWKGHDAPVVSVAWNASGEQVLSVSLRGEIRCWDATTGELLASRPAPRSGVLSVRALADGEGVVWAAVGGVLRGWNARDGARWFTARDILIGRVSDLSVDPARRFIVTASSFEPSSLRIFAANGELCAAPDTVQGSVTATTLWGEPPVLITGTDQGCFQVWDPTTGTELLRFDGEPVGPTCVVVSNDGARWIATGPGDLVQVWSRDGLRPTVSPDQGDGE